MIGWLRKRLGNAPEATAAHLVTGERGERAAARFLRSQGYKVLARRFRGKHGEIDLVARDGDTLAFVEVKTRGSDQFGAPADAVDGEKRRHLTSCAREYLKLLEFPRIPVRFDIVEVYWDDDAGRARECRLIQGAFQMTGHVSD